MSGEGARNGNGYEHAGGYKPAPAPISARGIATVVLLILFLFLFQEGLDRLLGREAGRESFPLLLAGVLLYNGFRAASDPRRDAEDSGDERELRKIRLWGIVSLAFGILIAADAVWTLRKSGMSAMNVGLVIVGVVALLIPLLSLAAYWRRDRSSVSTE